MVKALESQLSMCATLPLSKRLGPSEPQLTCLSNGNCDLKRWHIECLKYRMCSKTLSSFIFFFFFLPSLCKSQSKILFYTKINVKRKEISKPLPQACLCTNIWSSLPVGLCWTHVRCPEWSFRMWGQLWTWPLKETRPSESVTFTPSDADRIARKNEGMFSWCLCLSRGFCVVSLEGLPRHFSELAQLFGWL